MTEPIQRIQFRSDLADKKAQKDNQLRFKNRNKGIRRSTAILLAALVSAASLAATAPQISSDSECAGNGPTAFSLDIATGLNCVVGDAQKVLTGVADYIENMVAFEVGNPRPAFAKSSQQH